MRVKKGFTFAEILVVTCIIAVVASVAMPAIDDFMSSQKISSEAELFVSSVREARYKAMQEGALHRLVLDKDNDGNISGYKIQIYREYESETESETEDKWNLSEDENTDDSETGSIATTTNDEKKKIINFKEISTNDDDWRSILEYEEISFDSSIEVKHNPIGGNSIIYFYPTGYLVTGKSNNDSKKSDNISDTKYDILPENQLIFKYGSSQGIVSFNAMGILSTEITEIDDGGGA